MSTFGRDNYNNGTIETTKKANEDQSDLLVKILSFSENSKIEKKKKKKDIDVLENLHNLFEGRERFPNAFDGKIFSIKLMAQIFQARYRTILISKYLLLNKYFKDYQ